MCESEWLCVKDPQCFNKKTVEFPYCWKVPYFLGCRNMLKHLRHAAGISAGCLVGLLVEVRGWRWLELPFCKWIVFLFTGVMSTTLLYILSTLGFFCFVLFFHINYIKSANSIFVVTCREWICKMKVKFWSNVFLFRCIEITLHLCMENRDETVL